MAASTYFAQVQQLYIAYFGRAADDAGLNFWANAIESGLSTIESVATGFTLTPEYSSIYGNLSAETLVEQIYQNTFGRASDPAGKAFWVNLLATGAISADKIALQMISSMGDVDKALVDQKVVASNTYTHTAGVNYDIAAGKNVLAEINAGVGAADPTPPTSTPNPTATVINSGAGRDTIILTSAAEKVVIAAGNSAATEKASLDAALALVTARTALEDDAANAQSHIASFTTLIAAYNQALTSYTDLGGPLSDVDLENAYAALTTYSGIKFPLISAAVEIESADAITQNTFVNETAELSTALGAAQTALNGDVAAHGTTPELSTALGAAQTAFDTTFVASASPANQTDHDIITGFSLSADKLDLPETIVLTGTFSTVQTGNSLSITTNSNGVVEFGNATVNTTIEEKVSALLTAMGTAKATAAFVDNNNTYVVQGDGVSGLQSSDILVELTGVSNVTQLSTFII